MIVDGQKWACQSCVRGHRVSNCTHADRELQAIAPKGRPVKQCEHCRSARKDKSHHAKCNCGSKKQKDLSESGPKLDGFGCCCHKPGNKCICGVKSETDDLRIQESLLRRTLPVKSRPSLDTRNSENILTTGHPKLQHRNTLGHTACQPYTKPRRPASLHAPSYSATTGVNFDADLVTRAVDDMLPLTTSSLYGMGSVSAEPLRHGFGFNNYLSNEMSSGEPSRLFRTTSADAISLQSAYYDRSLGTVTESPADYLTSPTGMYGEIDWNIPSATDESFSPSDLPLSNSQIDFAQTISHSGESNYQSVSGLTAPSSGSQSEIDGPAGGTNAESFPPLWADTIQFRETTPVSGTMPNNGFMFPSSVPNYDGTFKTMVSPRRHRQTYSGSFHQHTESANSDSTAVPADLNSRRSVNIGHLQNLATLKTAREAAVRSSSDPLSGTIATGESDFASITIPNTEDYYDEFDFPTRPPQPTADSHQYGWLLDGA